jgi:hypothetical protein
MLLGIAFCLSCGCGGPGYEGEQRVAVSGSVTLDSEPLVYGTVRFVSVDGGLRPANGLIHNGKYSIPEEQGPNLGKYKVSIVGYEKSPAQAAPADGDEDGDGDEGEDEGEDDDESMDLGPQIVPATYNTQTTLEVDVTAEEKPYDFALKSE